MRPTFVPLVLLASHYEGTIYGLSRALTAPAAPRHWNRCDWKRPTACKWCLLEGDFGKAKRSGTGLLWGNVSHDNEQYATLALYMRLKGLVPPSSEK